MTLPLRDLRVWITRPADSAAASVAAWQAAGALAHSVPLVEVVPQRVGSSVIDRLASLPPTTRWVFTSGNAVRFLESALGRAVAARLRCHPAVAIGPATARVARDAGFCVKHVAPRSTGADLARELAAALRPGPALLPGSDLRRTETEQGLAQGGVPVLAFTAYRTVPRDHFPEHAAERLRRREVDAVALYSPSAAHAWAACCRALGEASLRNVVSLTLGPTTREAARAAGIPVAASAEQPGEAALLAAAETWWGARGRPQ